MKNGEQLFFEITSGENRIKIELSKAVKQNAEYDWDKNYIRAIVNFKSDTFQGKFETQFMTVDFEKFKRDVKQIYNTSASSAIFECLKNSLKLIIRETGEAHFYMEYFENKISETYNLEFELSFNRVQILSLIRQLEKITDAFPIIGNEFRITGTANFKNNRSRQKNEIHADNLFSLAVA